MELKVLFGIIATALAFVTYLPIYWGMFYGTIRPHIYTYIVWVITASVAFIASWISGGAAGSWSLGVTTLLVLGIFLLCFKYGTEDITRSDKVVLVIAIISIIPWIITKDPTISVVLVTFIEAISFIPTFRKTWNDPYSESYFPWSINTLKHGLIIAAVGSYSISTALYPGILIFMNIALAAEIILRRKMLEKQRVE